MQFLPRMRASDAGPRPEAAAAYLHETGGNVRLPFEAQIDDRTLLTQDGLLMQVIRLDGLMFETADTDELNYRKTLRDATLRAVASPRFAIYHHIIRRRVEPARTGSFPDAFSQGLDAIWTARLATKKLYANDLFLTVLRRPLRGSAGVAGRVAGLFGRGAKVARPDPTDAAELRALDAAVEQIVAALSAYGARILTAYDTPGGPCSEPLEFLSALYNAEFRPVRLPYGPLDDYLPYRRLSFGQDTLSLSPAGTNPGSLGAIVSIKDYPGRTTPGMLDDLLRIPAEMVISQSFAFVERGDGLARMNLVLRRMRATDDEARSLRDELAVAKDEVAAGRATMGEHHLSVLLRGCTQAEVDSGVGEVQAALTELGLVAVREDVGLEAAFWAQFPGNFKFITRGALIGSANFSSLASGHNFPVGRAHGNVWGDAVTLFETTAAGPYHFNFHHGDLGNFTVIGPSGSGKTVIVNFLLAQARRFNPRIVFFDKDRGAELFLRAIGGTYEALRPGNASCLNPLRLPDTAENRRFLLDWVGRLAMLDGEQPDPEEQRQIKAAVDANFGASSELRRLRHFVELLRGGHRPHERDLYARLRPWWGGGEHAWLFDNADDRVDLSHQAIGFDMTRLLDDPVLRTPAMMYLFHRVDQRLDGNPAIIVIDEGWKALNDEFFVARIRDWEKTIRKRGGIVGFTTQNAEDALDSRIASAIVEQSATQIFTANPKARAEDYVDGFGLTAHEYQLIRNLPDTSRCFLVKHGRESVVVRLNLAGEQELLTILSGRERTVRLLDDIRARVGDAPEDWLPELVRLS